MPDETTTPTEGAPEGGAPVVDGANDNGASPTPGEGGVQARIDELTKKRYDAERDAAYWKGVAESKATPTPPEPKTPTPKELNPDDFESQSDYIRAVAEQAREEIRREREAEKERERKSKVAQTIGSKYSEGRKKYKDFDTVALNPSVPVTQAMFDAAMGDHLDDILYHLGNNTTEAARIAGLTPTQQIKEIGKIEDRITAKPPAKTTAAPKPPSTVSGGGSAGTKTETEMSREELRKKWDAERRRAAGLGA